MKTSDMIRKAWRTYTASPERTAKFLLTETCLTLICLAPLLFLTGRGLQPGAWAALPLWLLVMLPARINAAKAMGSALAGGDLDGKVLVETEGYGEKLLCGLKRVFFLLLWGAPLIFLAVEFRIHFAGELDSFTVLRMIKKDLGGGDQMRGIWMLVLMLVGALLILMAGCAFHSGARHAFARGNPGLVRGRHGRVMLAWLVSQVSVLPLLAAAAVIVFRYLPVISDLNGWMMGTVNLPDTRGTLLILGIGGLLTLPLLPLRGLISAACVEALEQKN